MPGLIENGHLHLAVPPLYKIKQGKTQVYASDERRRDELLASDLFRKGAKPDVQRFKGLGEMNSSELKETTMDPRNRRLLRVEVAAGQKPETEEAVASLMGSKPEARFRFIQERAEFVSGLDV